MAPRSEPTTRFESRLFKEGASLVAGVDEVGRGAWAGPVSVGICVTDRRGLRRFPKGVKDSKMLTQLQRERLFDPLSSSVLAYAVGHASAAECDALGMTAAQRLATERAFSSLLIEPDAVIVDGKFDFTGRSDTVSLVGADRLSLVVAAASVLAKVTRDRLMVEAAPSYPLYEFEQNKGYPSPSHKRALRRHGMSDIHRKSWSFALSLEQTLFGEQALLETSADEGKTSCTDGLLAAIATPKSDAAKAAELPGT